MPPDANTRREAQEWMLRAERDLQAARNELNASPPLPEMTVYHVQQAVEKALKGFLVLHGLTFPPPHDLPTYGSVVRNRPSIRSVRLGCPDDQPVLDAVPLGMMPSGPGAGPKVS